MTILQERPNRSESVSQREYDALVADVDLLQDSFHRNVQHRGRL